MCVICFIKKEERPFLKFLNSIKTLPAEILVNQHSNFPLPLPILTPLGFRVNGRWGNAKNQTKRLVLSDFLEALFKNNLNLNNWFAVKWIGFRRSKPAPPKFNLLFNEELLKESKLLFLCFLL